MRRWRLAVFAGAAVAALSLVAWAQLKQRPGLYEVTANMTWQQSPMPGNMPAMPAGAHNPFGGGPHTSQICVTQEQIDKYGTAPPQTRNGCEVTNIDKTANGMTADMVCTGPFSGKGTIEASWTDPGHSTSIVHFVGAMQMGQNSKPIEWTMESASVYKGTDCGSVKPFVMPRQR